MLALITSEFVVVLGIVPFALFIIIIIIISFFLFFFFSGGGGGGGGFINGVEVIRAIQLEFVILGLVFLVLVYFNFDSLTSSRTSL
jgi:hypothetical protein